MKSVLSAAAQHLVSLSFDELLALANCLNEVLHNSDIDADDCGTRIGVGLEALAALHRDLKAELDRPAASQAEVFEAWRDGESAQIRAISVFGDPADLSLDELREKIQPLLDEAP